MSVLAFDRGPDTPALPMTTIGGALDEAVLRYPDREALVSVEQGLRFTYAELSAAVDDVARGLLARGVAKGDRVGIWAPNCAEWVLVQYATARIGAVLVTINPAYRTHELTYVLKQAGVKGFPITSYRLRNLLTDTPQDMEPLRRICGDLPYTQQEGTDATVAWMKAQESGTQEATE